jgi:hypothetical protein
VSFSGESGLLVAFEAPNPLSPDNVMASGHLLQLGRSASIQHVNIFQRAALGGIKNL